MVKGIIYNFRTDKDGVSRFDPCFVGEPFQYYSGLNLIVDKIELQNDMSALITAHTEDDKEKVDEIFVITQVGVHSVIETYE